MRLTRYPLVQAPARPASPLRRGRWLLAALLLLLATHATQAQAPAWGGAASGSIRQSAGNSQTRAVATDAAGNVFVVGYFDGTIGFGSTLLTSAGVSDLFVAKWVPATGTWAWAQRGGGIGEDFAFGVAVSGSSIYVTGGISSNNTNATGFTLGGTNAATGTTQVNGVSAYLAGTEDVLLLKYQDNGTSASLVWTQVGGGDGNDYGYGVAVSGTSVYVTGSLTNTSSNAKAVLFGGGGTTAGTTPVNGASTTASADLVLAKYTDNGSSASLGWTQVGGGTGPDQGQAIAVSGTGVYVTGYVTNTTANANSVVFGGGGTTAGTSPVNGASTTASADLVLAKYTDNGPSASLGWTQVGGGTGFDQGTGVAVSGTSVFVTGGITNNTGNGNGVVFGGTTPGAVPVSGASATTSADLVLAKYTDQGPSAALRWTQVGGGTGNDQASGVAVSGTSVYVTGTVTNNAADANQVRFGGTGTTAGTVPVPGASATASQDALLARYTDNGTTATLGWTLAGGGTGGDVGVGVAVVGGGTVYTGGSVGASPTYAFGAANTLPVQGTLGRGLALAQATDAGTSGSWTALAAIFNGGVSEAAAVAADASGNVFVAGYFRGRILFGTTLLISAGGDDLFVAKWVPATGTWAWVQRGGGTGPDRGQGIAVSGSSIYVTGYISNTTTNASSVTLGGTGPATGTTQLNGATGTANLDLVLLKYTDSGPSAALTWTQVGGGTSYDQGTAVAVRGTSVYVAGTLVNNTSNAQQVLFGGSGTTAGTVPVNGASATNSADLVLAKYTDNGPSATLGWTQVGGGTGLDEGKAVAVSGTSVYLAGTFTNGTANANAVVFGGGGTTAGTSQVNGATATTSPDLVLAKYTDNGATGTYQWSEVGGTTDYDEGFGVAASGTSVYLTGYLYNDAANTNGALFGGGGTTLGTTRVNGVTSTISADLVLAKYTDNGSTATLGWTQVGGGSGFDVGNGVAVSGTSVYVTGSIVNDAANANGVLFGGGGTTAGTSPVAGGTIYSSEDVLLAKYTDNGSTAAFAWGRTGGGHATDTGYGVAVSGQQLYVAAVTVQSATFGPTVLPNLGGYYFAALPYLTDPTLQPLAAHPAGAASAEGFTLYPNPAGAGATLLAGAAPGATVQVLDALGRAVLATTADAAGTAHLTHLTPGFYLVRVGPDAVRLSVE